MVLAGAIVGTFFGVLPWLVGKAILSLCGDKHWIAFACLELGVGGLVIAGMRLIFSVLSWGLGTEEGGT